MREPPGRQAARVGWRLVLLGAALALLGGCERGCARSWFARHGVGSEGSPQQPGSALINAVDCPDGLARCSAGTVEVSLLSMIPQPCRGTPEECACRWEAVGDCARDCVVERLEVVVAREKAPRQLCAPPPGTTFVTAAPPDQEPRGCDEGHVYRCAGGLVTACRDNAVIARCLQGCEAEGASVDDDVPVSREGAFAILCSR